MCAWNILWILGKAGSIIAFKQQQSSLQNSTKPQLIHAPPSFPSKHCLGSLTSVTAPVCDALREKLLANDTETLDCSADKHEVSQGNRPYTSAADAN